MDIKLSQLSKELVVLRLIKRLNDNGNQATFFTLVKILNDEGLASRGTVSKALDILFDQSAIYAEWGLTKDNKHCRVLKIRSHAVSLAEKLQEFN